MAIKFVIVFISCFVLLLAVGQLFVRNKTPANRVLFGFLILCCIWLTHSTFYLFDIIYLYPHANKTYLPFFCLCGPMWYVYVKCLFSNYQIQPKVLLHLIPSIICVFLSIPFYLESAEFKNNYIGVDFYDFTTISIYIATRIAEITVGTYFVFAIIFLTHIQLNDQKAIRLIMTLTGVSLTAVIIRFVGSVFGSPVFSVLVPSAIISICFVGIYCLSHQYPTLLCLGLATPKHKKNPLCDKELLETYQQKIELERWYLDPDFKVQLLADLLNTQVNQLSKLINTTTGENFNCFINEFRIKHAKTILLQEPNRSVLDIAFASGFNSKSAFYNYFTHCTSMTPSEFKKANQACTS